MKPYIHKADGWWWINYHQVFGTRKPFISLAGGFRTLDEALFKLRELYWWGLVAR